MLGHVATSIGNALPGGGADLPLPVFARFPAAGSGTWTAPRDGTLLIYLWGAGGSGSQAGSGTGIKAGGGGAALFKRVAMVAGQTVSYTVGAGGVRSGNDGLAGGNSTLILPNGTVLTAGGGAGAVTSGSANASGGVATGGDLNRSGGQGHVESGAAATGGQNGGAAGINGGGGAGGFTDLNFPILGGQGRTIALTSDTNKIDADNGRSNPGGGGAIATVSTNYTTGSPGALYLILE